MTAFVSASQPVPTQAPWGFTGYIRINVLDEAILRVPFYINDRLPLRIDTDTTTDWIWIHDRSVGNFDLFAQAGFGDLPNPILLLPPPPPGTYDIACGGYSGGWRNDVKEGVAIDGKCNSRVTIDLVTDCTRPYTGSFEGSDGRPLLGFPGFRASDERLMYLPARRQVHPIYAGFGLWSAVSASYEYQKVFALMRDDSMTLHVVNDAWLGPDMDDWIVHAGDYATMESSTRALTDPRDIPTVTVFEDDSEYSFGDARFGPVDTYLNQVGERTERITVKMQPLVLPAINKSRVWIGAIT